jgi:hypothetical protein
MGKFGNCQNLAQSHIIDADKTQKKISDSQKEMQRICIESEKYRIEKKITIEETIHYILLKLGYAKEKVEYIYNDCEKLFEISMLSQAYMRKHGIRPETFVYKFIETYEYCQKNGYDIDINQRRLF